MISFAVTAKLICAFVFAYAECWFSYDAAHIWVVLDGTDMAQVEIKTRTSIDSSIKIKKKSVSSKSVVRYDEKILKFGQTTIFSYDKDCKETPNGLYQC